MRRDRTTLKTPLRLPTNGHDRFTTAPNSLVWDGSHIDWIETCSPEGLSRDRGGSPSGVVNRKSSQSQRGAGHHRDCDWNESSGDLRDRGRSSP
jgi:hypothetical protein